MKRIVRNIFWSFTLLLCFGCGKQLGVGKKGETPQARETNDGGGDTSRTFVSDGLVLHYDVAKGNRGTSAPTCGHGYLWDVSTNGWDGIAYNIPTSNCTSAVSGWQGAGTDAAPHRLAFDGVDDDVRIGNRQVSTGTNLTLEFWIFPAATQKANSTILSKHNGTPGSGFTVEQTTTKTNKYFFAYNGGSGWSGNTEAQSIQLMASKWQHFVVVKMGAAVTFYVNGSNVGGYTGSGSAIANNNESLTLGQFATQGADRHWKGEMGIVRIYSNALTLEQVRQNCNAQKSRFPGATCI